MTDCGDVDDAKLQNEQCWVLVGQCKGSLYVANKLQPTEGAPTRVEFDYDWVTKRDEQHGDVIGFLHTHPSGLLEPSQRDVDTMRAWTSSLGKPLFCLIQCDDQVVGFRFMNDQCRGQRAGEVQLFPVDGTGENIVVIYDSNEKQHKDAADG